MRIVVDADACPVKDEILRIAAARNLAVVFVCNFHHQIRESENVTVVVVDDAPDEADYCLFNLLQPGDIVVTQDFGLAAMVLGRDAQALSPRGLRYTHANITPLLEKRHRHREAMERGRFPKGQAKFQKADRGRFIQALTLMLEGS